MTDAEFVTAGTAQVWVLHEGYVREDTGGDRVGGAAAGSSPQPR